MKVVVAGSRGITEYWKVETALLAHWPNDSSPKHCDGELVTGGANGVDSNAEQFAEKHDIECTLFDPYNAEETATEYSYNQYFGQAFLKRNEEMAEYGDRLIAVWDGESNGTRHMIDAMLDEGKPVHVSVQN